MRYVSTRDRLTLDAPGRPFSEILLAGLAPDGGLYLPQIYPRVEGATLERWRSVLADEGYAALAFEVVRLFVDDIGEEDLRAICERAYAPEKFGADDQRDLVPVTALSDRVWLGHLSNGPTAAFKDMAMQLLAQLFAYELDRRGQVLNILGATSGDTGSAAEHAMAGHENIRTFMLTPAGRMTPFQQAQMFSLDDDSVVNVALDGVFDDCQDVVKDIGADAEFKARWHIGAVNSINWARLMAQVVYYVALWLRVSGELGDASARVHVSVPTGNFGDICAGHVAKAMGVPLGSLVCATNENDVLDEFFRTGVYRPRTGAETVATSSPSMDISRASNFERFVFDLLGRDAARTSALFTELATRGSFDLSQDPAFAAQRETHGLVSSSSTHADRLATIRAVDAREGIVIDPHTADAATAVTRLRDSGELDGPTIVLETALPVKFEETIAQALGRVPQRPPRFAGIEDLPRHVVDLPNDAQAVRALIQERGLRA